MYDPIDHSTNESSRGDDRDAAADIGGDTP
jgi:hypothetical protein